MLASMKPKTPYCEGPLKSLLVRARLQQLHIPMSPLDMTLQPNARAQASALRRR